jgi:NADH:ubiquinone oxidoreductase subunit F (NADH-binding)
MANPYHHASQHRLRSESPVPQQRLNGRHLRLVDGLPEAALPEDAAAEAKHEKSWASLRLLPSAPIVTLADYRAGGGLRGLEIATTTAPPEIVSAIQDSGLRGRGGAGFPTGRKWRTVAGRTAAGCPADVVVNGAEGEPGTFKDRSILRHNPYLVIEGAFIAAHAVGADRVIIALKASFTEEVARTRAALAELRALDVLPTDIACAVFEGPDEYLYGEETALLETIGGGGPFPRNAPPYRVGLLDQQRRLVAGPALVNNVETIANVPAIVARGARWFRTIGTPESPGSVVCTVTGDVREAGVGEVPMGVPLRRVLDDIGGGALGPVKAVFSGVANPVILEDHLDQPVSHEGMRAAGCGLGSAGFIVFADPVDMVAVAAGIARFLATESCGQCTPCKTDGGELAALLERLALSRARAADLETIERRIGTVDYGARCYLGSQQAIVLASIHERFRPEFGAHLTGGLPPAEPVLIAELLDIRDGKAVIDERHRRKQPDWSYGRTSSGAAPADRKARHRSTPLQLPSIRT